MKLRDVLKAVGCDTDGLEEDLMDNEYLLKSKMIKPAKKNLLKMFPDLGLEGITFCINKYLKEL